MTPFRGLLYTYNKSAFFKGLCQMSSIFVSLKNLTFRCILFQMYYSCSNLKFKKSFLTSDLLPLFTITWNINDQTSLQRPYVELENFFLFVFLSCMFLDSCHNNYTIHLKFELCCRNKANCHHVGPEPGEKCPPRRSF